MRKRDSNFLCFPSVGFHGGSAGKESTCNAGDLGSIPGSEDPWRRERLPTPVFWPGEFHGGGKESDKTEQPSPSLSHQCFFFSGKIQTHCYVPIT